MVHLLTLVINSYIVEKILDHHDRFKDVGLITIILLGAPVF